MLDLLFEEFSDDFIPHVRYKSKQERKAALEVVRTTEMKAMERKTNKSKRVVLSNKNVKVRILKQKGR